MVTKTSTLLRAKSILLVCVVAAACGSTDSSPTAPSATTPAPIAESGPAPGSDSGPGNLEVEVTPNPVPWNSTPASESSCGDVLNTWFYTQVLRNTGGNAIVVSDRTDYFNNRVVSSRSNLGITLEPGAETRITTRWCSVSSVVQTAQTDWRVTDATTADVLTVVGPRVTLQAK